MKESRLYNGSMDRVIRVAQSFEEAEAIDLDQWLELSGEQRMHIGEQMRQEVFGAHDQRLERILRVAEQPGD
jgi:hypothetical protein